MNEVNDKVYKIVLAACLNDGAKCMDVEEDCEGLAAAITSALVEADVVCADEVEDTTRVFFVVDGIEKNEEIFETLEAAQEFAATLPKKEKARLRVCLVRHAYREESIPGRPWNYDDQVDTFAEVARLPFI